MSAPEWAAPTTSTGPACSCDGLRYSLECICVIAGSSSEANSGTIGSWKVPDATTTLSASKRWAPARTT